MKYEEALKAWRLELLALNNVVRLNRLHKNSDRSTSGLQHFESKKRYAGWNIIRYLQGRRDTFILYRDRKIWQLLFIYDRNIPITVWSGSSKDRTYYDTPDTYWSGLEKTTILPAFLFTTRIYEFPLWSGLYLSPNRHLLSRSFMESSGHKTAAVTLIMWQPN